MTLLYSWWRKFRLFVFTRSVFIAEWEERRKAADTAYEKTRKRFKEIYKSD